MTRVANSAKVVWSGDLGPRRPLRSDEDPRPIAWSTASIVQRTRCSVGGKMAVRFACGGWSGLLTDDVSIDLRVC